MSLESRPSLGHVVLITESSPWTEIDLCSRGFLSFEGITALFSIVSAWFQEGKGLSRFLFIVMASN